VVQLVKREAHNLMEYRYNVRKTVYVFGWTKRRKRERESRQTIWVLSYGDASGI
jgi:hypothetical protein